MAYQLVTSAGRPDLCAIVSDSDRRGVSPGSEALKTLLNSCGPCLILMDELVAYAKKIYGLDGLPAGPYDNFITFIQEITEAARASENSIVVASIPEAEIEIGGDAGKTALETIEHTFGRMESIWKPVAANEGFEVVRRRLFLDRRDTETRDMVCNAFSSMYQDNSTDFPTEAKEVEYRNRMVSCYPIHPEIFDRSYGDRATLERFQRTRGVLRLMAAVIHELWMANDSSAMSWCVICRIHETASLTARLTVRIRFPIKRISPHPVMDRSWQHGVSPELLCWEVRRVHPHSVTRPSVGWKRRGSVWELSSREKALRISMTH